MYSHKAKIRDEYSYTKYSYFIFACKRLLIFFSLLGTTEMKHKIVLSARHLKFHYLLPLWVLVTKNLNHLSFQH